jgi:hypothetical protein
MKQLTRRLTGLGILVPLLGASVASAQDDLPLLEMPTATSATALDGFENRRVSTDFDYIFLPAGSGGEQVSDEAWRYASGGLASVGTDIAKRITPKDIPTYALVEPNRAIETQTDPQRLTISAPTRN